MTRTMHLTVDPDGRVAVPGARPGQTVTVHIVDAPDPPERLTLATARTEEELVGKVRDARARLRPVLLLLARFSPADQSWLEPMHYQFTRGRTTPDKLWVRVRSADEQERTYCMSRGEGARAEDTLLMLADAEGEESTRRLTESLVEAAGALLHCRDEQSVLETAVEAIHRHGLLVMVLLLEGDSLRYGPMRQDSAQVATCELLYGQPIQEIRFPRASMPHIEEVLARHPARD